MIKEYDISIPYINKGDTFIMLLPSCIVAACTNCVVIVTKKHSTIFINNLKIDIISLLAMCHLKS